MTKATVFAPGTVGNVGPGYDCLGVAVGGIGDRITVELTDGPPRVAHVTGRDAAAVPTDPERNCAVIAARAMLKRLGESRAPAVSLERALPVSGGLGASAAASVGGALAAARAAGQEPSQNMILQAAVVGEEAVAAGHYDNLAPCLYGGLCLVKNGDKPRIFSLAVGYPYWMTLVTPEIKIQTKDARAVLPEVVSQGDFVQQMGYTAGVVAGLVTGNDELLRHSLVDLFAEPRRAPLVPHFRNVKTAAESAGALGCSLSGAGPTLFALSRTEEEARSVEVAMTAAFSEVAASSHVGRISSEGAVVV